MTADTVGGVWTYSLELARALAPHGIHVILATMGGLPSPAQKARAAEIPNLTLHASAYRLEWMPDPWGDVHAAGRWLEELAADVQPDLVHLNNYAHGPLAWPAPVVMVGHSCVLSWWEAVKGQPAPPEWNRYERVVRAGLQAAEVVLAPTQAMLGALNHHYGPFRQTRVIPNGRDPQAFRPAEKEPFIFAAGRLWDEAKNIVTLAETAGSHPWPVYVAGDASHPAGGEADFPDLETLGELDHAEVADWMSRAAVYALPARYEPFGLTPLEAALSGAVLVLGDIASLREVWGSAALYVAPDDRETLARLLQHLINRPVWRSQLALRARRRALLYTPDRMASRYARLYTWLARELPVARPTLYPTLHPTASTTALSLHQDSLRLEKEK